MRSSYYNPDGWIIGPDGVVTGKAPESFSRAEIEWATTPENDKESIFVLPNGMKPAKRTRLGEPMIIHTSERIAPVSVEIKKGSIPQGIVDYILGTNDGAVVTITATFATHTPESPDLREHRTINVTWSEIKCSCAAPSNEICSHVNLVLLGSLDSALIWRFLEGEKETANLEVPLFSTGSSVFSVSTELHKKRYPAGVFAEVFIKASDVETTTMFEGGYTSAGSSFHKLGVVGRNDGREAIRGMIASWVKSQDAIIEKIKGLDALECDSYYHGALAEANGYISSDPRERTSIYITGECISCWLSARNIDSDVPEV